MPAVGGFVATTVVGAIFGSAVPVWAGTLWSAIAFTVNAGLLFGASTIGMNAMAPEVTPMAAQLSNVIDSMPPKRFLYGETRVGATLVYAKALKTYNSDLSPRTKKNQCLHMVYEIAGHPCDSFQKVLLNGINLGITPVSGQPTDYLFPNTGASWGVDSNGVTRYKPSGTDFDNWLMCKLYTGSQTVADADLIEACQANSISSDPWTSRHIGKEKTYMYVRMLYKPSLFKGIPKFSFLMRGKNDMSGGYTDNVAKCLYDYMTTPTDEGGLGESSDSINSTRYASASSVCDELPEVFDDGTTQKRYTCGCTFTTAEEPHAVITNFLSSMSGWMEMVNGKWNINAGGYTAPSQTLTESEMRGHIGVSLNRPFRETFNSVKPVLRSDEYGWQPSNADSIEAITKIDITLDSATDTFTAASHPLSDGDRVKLVSWTGTAIDNSNLPGNASETAFYYVVNSSTNTFQLSLTDGGSAVNFSSNGSGLVAFWDVYLSRDTERRATELVLPFVTNITQAKRLALIALLQSRQEMAVSVKCKLGTAYACPFDLEVGDSVRLIDQHKSFWEVTGSASTPDTGENVITYVSHPFSNGDPVVVLDADSTSLDENRPYYVCDATADAFSLANYRGGAAVTIETGNSIEIQPIQGKLFRVKSWKLTLDEGVPGVDMTLVETVSNIYTWEPSYEVAPASKSSITTQSLIDVETPANFAVESGTDVLYIRDDGTIGSRAHLTWDEAGDAYITEAGTVEIQYKENGSSLWIPWPTVPGGSTEAYINDLDDSVSYDFQIRFVNDFGNHGEYAQVLAHTVVGKTEPPDPVTGLAFDAYDDNGKTQGLTWTDPTDLDLSHCNVYRFVSDYITQPGSGDWEFIGTAPKGAQKFIDTGVWASGESKYFHYAVETEDTSGNKTLNYTWTGDWNRTTVSPPTAPSLTVTAPSEGLRVQATWSSVAQYDDTDLEVVIYPDEANGKDKAIFEKYAYSDEKFIYLLPPGSAGDYIVEAVRVAKLKAGKIISQKYTSSAVTVTEDTTAPGAPTGVTATYDWDTDSIKLEWNAVSAIDLTHYNIWRKKDSDPYEKVNTYGADQDATEKPQWIDSGVFAQSTSGTTYTYQIKAVDQSGNASSAGTSNAVSIEPDTPLTVTIGGSEDGPAITLAWNNSDSSLAEHDIVARFGPNETGWAEGDSKRFRVKTGAQTGRIIIPNDHEQVGVTAGTLNGGDGFKVAYYTDSGSTGAPRKSKLSSETAVTVPEDTTDPDAPTNFSYSWSARGAVLLWANPKNIDLRSIEIQRKEGSGGTYETIDFSSPSFSYVDGSVPPNTVEINTTQGDYYYRIRAKDSAGNTSAWVTYDAGAGKRTKPSSVTNLTIGITEVSTGNIEIDARFDPATGTNRIYMEISTPTEVIWSNTVSRSGAGANTGMIQSVSSGSLTYTCRAWAMDVYGNVAAEDTDTATYTP